MPSLLSDKSKPNSPTSTLKSGKRQSKRRDAILDAFRSLHHQVQHDEGEEATLSEPEDAIAILNASGPYGSIRSSKQQSHGRSKSFFLGSSQRKGQPILIEEKEQQIERKPSHAKAREASCHQTLEQVSDLVCLKADASVLGSMDRTTQLWIEKKGQMEQQDKDEFDYSSLYSQLILPSNVSSQRHRSTTIASIRDDMEAKALSLNDSYPCEVISPLPPKRLNRRRRAQSSFGTSDDSRIKALSSGGFNPSRHVSENMFLSMENAPQSEEQVHCVPILGPRSKSFGIVSESSHSFQSLSALQPRRGEAASATPIPVTQRRKASLSSSGSGSCNNSLGGSPDSFTSASSEWAGSCYSSATTVNKVPGTRSRSSSIASSSASFEMRSCASKLIEEERHPLPPIPARFLVKNDVLKTPTFGNSTPPHASIVQTSPSTISNATSSIYDVFPAQKISQKKVLPNESVPRNPNVTEVYVSARSSSRSEGIGYGLGLSHVKLALAKDIRPLRKESP